MTDVEVLSPREVPLGGPRAMRVRRTLPQRHRSLIGAWCFVDHYGPDEVDETGGMGIPRPVPMMAMAKMERDVATPISPGENVLSVNLDVVFELGT